MTRPRDVGVVDLMMELPTGDAGMGMAQARRLLRDDDSAEFASHPAEYLFADAGERMGRSWDPDEVVAMMDAHGVVTAQLAVDPRSPETAFELFDRYPGRFIGEVGVDPNRGMRSVRRLAEIAEAHPAVRSASLAPCLHDPQVPIDDRRCYPIYAKCCELGLPINVLVGVPGPRVPYEVQHPGLLDQVCWFFPELTVVMRHGGEPWTSLCIKLMTKWPRLHYSTTAFAPKWYPRDVMAFADSSRGRHKVLFAGYFPGLSYERIFGELDDLELSAETWPAFLRDNARRVYGLDDLPGPGSAHGGAS